MTRTSSLVYLIASVSAFWGCGHNPVVSSEGRSTIQFAARLQTERHMAKRAASQNTGWDSLIVVVEAEDMGTERFSFVVDRFSDLIVYESFDVQAGEDRNITAFTVDANLDTIHGAQSVVKTFLPNETISLSMTLSPICGSIYISLSDFQDDIDSVRVSFHGSIGQWNAAAPVTSHTSSAREFLSLDKIPYGTEGLLLVSGLSGTGDTIVHWSDSLVFGHDDITLTASFVTVGFVGIDVQTEDPGVTLVEARMSTSDSIEAEPDSSPVIISEIMYAANDSEYVELYNPTPESLFFDTLYLEKNGTQRLLRGIAIPAEGFAVIARSDIPWADTSITLLDFSSTSGNTITLRTRSGDLLDRVAFIAGRNDLDWPYVTDKASIVLANLSNDPTANNYGKAWAEAVSRIDQSSTSQRGTPRAPGL